MDETERVDERHSSTLQVPDTQHHAETSPDIRLARWKRYGYDRLYVKGPNGIEIGFVDLHTGTTHCGDDAVWPPEADPQIAQWCTDHGVTVPASRQPPPEPQATATHDPPPPPPAPPQPVAMSAALPEAAIAADNGDAAVSAGSNVRRKWKDLSKNRAGASLKAAAKERKTWWARIVSVFGVETPSTPWDAGYKGERKLARTMWFLRPFGWRILHSVPFGSRGSDIDHILIGPGGVVTVNTKHYRGAKITAGHTKVLVNGHPEPYAQKSQYEFREASRLLSTAAGHPVDVEALIVFVGARSVRSGKTAGIDVLARIELPMWLLSHRGHLDRQQRRDLFDIARRSTTWQGL